MIQTTEFFTSTDLFPLWVECVNDILFPPSFESSSISSNSLDGNDNDDNEKDNDEDEEKYNGEYYSDLLPVFDLTEKTNEATTTTTTTMPDHYYYNDEHKKSKWTENAMLISSTIDDMTNYLRQNACAYVGTFEGISSSSSLAAAAAAAASFEKMDSAESSEFEFMITSFTVSTANQIEQLRKTQTNAILEETKNSSSSNNNMDLQNHHAAILAILLSRLQEDVMKTMNELIKLRKLHNNENEDSERSDSDFEKQEEEEDRMEDNEEAHPLNNLTMFHNESVSQNHQTSSSQHHLSNEEEEDVVSKYEDEHSAMNHLNNKETSNDNESTLNSTQKILPYPKKEYPKKRNQHKIINQDSSVIQDENGPTPTSQQTQTQILYEPQTQNLQEIQKIETNMIQITQLLQQFSSLVEAQTEQVEFIHEAAMDAKESMEKGTDQIVDATERKESSPHHMAKFIFSLGVLLLMMNSIMY